MFTDVLTHALACYKCSEVNILQKNAYIRFIVSLKAMFTINAVNKETYYLRRKYNILGDGVRQIIRKLLEL